MGLLGNISIDLSSPNITELSLLSTSKGNQRKYYDRTNHCYIKEPFRYKGRTWRDYMVEHLSWRLSTMMDTFGVYVVKQDIVCTGESYACISKDFVLMTKSGYPLIG